MNIKKNASGIKTIYYIGLIVSEKPQNLLECLIFRRPPGEGKKNVTRYRNLSLLNNIPQTKLQLYTVSILNIAGVFYNNKNAS